MPEDTIPERLTRVETSLGHLKDSISEHHVAAAAQQTADRNNISQQIGGLADLVRTGEARRDEARLEHKADHLILSNDALHRHEDLDGRVAAVEKEVVKVKTTLATLNKLWLGVLAVVPIGLTIYKLIQG